MEGVSAAVFWKTKPLPGAERVGVVEVREDSRRRVAVLRRRKEPQ